MITILVIRALQRNILPAVLRCDPRRGQVLRKGAKQALHQTTACLCNAAQVRERRRFLSLSLSHQVADVITRGGNVLPHVQTTLRRRRRRLHFLFYFFGDENGAPRERDF